MNAQELNSGLTAEPETKKLSNMLRALCKKLSMLKYHYMNSQEVNSGLTAEPETKN